MNTSIAERQPIQIDVQLSIRDVRKVLYWLIWGRRTILIAAPPALALCTLAVWWQWSVLDATGRLIVPSALVTFWCCLLWYAAAPYWRAVRVSPRTLFELRHFSFSDESLSSSSASDSETLRWDCFQSTRENSEYFLLYTSEVNFLIIPKHSFGDPAEVGTFRTLLQQHIPSKRT